MLFSRYFPFRFQRRWKTRQYNIYDKTHQSTHLECLERFIVSLPRQLRRGEIFGNIFRWANVLIVYINCSWAHSRFICSLLFIYAVESCVNQTCQTQWKDYTQLQHFRNIIDSHWCIQKCTSGLLIDKAEFAPKPKSIIESCIVHVYGLPWLDDSSVLCFNLPAISVRWTDRNCSCFIVQCFE